MNEKDLSWKEDLTTGCMNLISIEEHSSQSFFTSEKDYWLKIIDETRKIRTRWMRIILDEEKGSYDQFYKDAGDLLGMFYWLLENRNKEKKDQCWCVFKHILASSIRGFEVGNKFLEMQEDKEDKSNFFNNVKKGLKFISGGADGKEKKI